MVAQNVVLLALLFIYRLKKLNPTVRGKPGSEYRLLTVALPICDIRKKHGLHRRQPEGEALVSK